jgi:hypothetical protein
VAKYCLDILETEIKVKIIRYRKSIVCCFSGRLPDRGLFLQKSIEARYPMIESHQQARPLAGVLETDGSRQRTKKEEQK